MTSIAQPATDLHVMKQLLRVTACHFSVFLHFFPFLSDNFFGILKALLLPERYHAQNHKRIIVTDHLVRFYRHARSDCSPKTRQVFRQKDGCKNSFATQKRSDIPCRTAICHPAEKQKSPYRLDQKQPSHRKKTGFAGETHLARQKPDGIPESCFQTAPHRPLRGCSFGDLAAAFKNTYDPLSLKSNAALVLDESNLEILFEKNGNIALPMASITKLMTGLVDCRNPCRI